MEAAFLDRSLRLFTIAEFSCADLAALLDVHEQTVRRWRLRQIGFKDKTHIEAWVAITNATFKALKNKELPFRAISGGKERQRHIKNIVSRYL